MIYVIMLFSFIQSIIALIGETKDNNSIGTALGSVGHMTLVVVLMYLNQRN